MNVRERTHIESFDKAACPSSLMQGGISRSPSLLVAYLMNPGRVVRSCRMVSAFILVRQDSGALLRDQAMEMAFGTFRRDPMGATGPTKVDHRHFH